MMILLEADPERVETPLIYSFRKPKGSKVRGALKKGRVYSFISLLEVDEDGQVLLIVLCSGSGLLLPELL